MATQKARHKGTDIEVKPSETVNGFRAEGRNLSDDYYTNAEVNAALKAALDEKGHDYVYPVDANGNCVYQKDGAPSCLVGYVVHALDPKEFERVAAFEADQGMNKGDTSFGNVALKLGLRFHPDQRWALELVQSAQDHGDTWGDAVAIEWASALGERL